MPPPAAPPATFGGRWRCARASAKRHRTRRGGVVHAAFAPPAHRKKALATRATGLRSPLQKKEKHRRSPCKEVALVAGCFRSSHGAPGKPWVVLWRGVMMNIDTTW